jgi:hypothetical protein
VMAWISRIWGAGIDVFGGAKAHWGGSGVSRGRLSDSVE